MRKVNKVVLAYSGGLDTSAIIPWLKENYDCEVVAFAADVGQGDEELEGLKEKAIATGASECYIVDLKEEFVKEYIFPTITTGAVYEGEYLLGTSMARPVIAKAQVEIARKVGADALCHGCTGKGNDQVRFEGAFNALAPDLAVIAPWREWDMVSREDLLAYLAERNIKTTASATKIYSRDANAWHISHEGGELEDPWCEPSKQVWTMTVDPEEAPDQAERVNLKFFEGALTHVNGKEVSPYEGLVELNKLAAAHGVGRIDIVENRLVGMKSRGCYETPGGTVLLKAYKALETMVLDKASLKHREQLALEFSHVMYDGRWFTPLSDALIAGAASFAKYVTGEIVVKLYKGQATVTQRQSPNSLYSEDFATFGADDVYDQKHAEGFIRLFSLSSRIAALKKQGE
ncbi:argininosuccinate synthase [Marisediminitalea aggregata]|jgi:argininosuccinate synthase|uniref:Argininosuccinate synthase n=1 Tax=Marisediminitalea aggregata TaxID=634436 RepID=A0A1M5NWR9_9ALTE|nr:argininosuccinate synthase [Marisediminitalea aggregata]MAP22677.1 argininosuccinate synthase [Alteromonadaceae bacterium]MEC7825751.1 argininosuccinate synthase [Pseudomonadota bacterium]BBO25983.1 argininosuccinate synthase [Alteromonas sp. I4]MAX41973.1 argininosuccinate synthase [Alteromonadaceae bacterium]MBL53719.1 argininosuccinate synthase [Alteromonadaceae bacterium]|tara:strand:+ start:27313 stop:28521 length:1209 start_codon:yes stop_codon:yes gene_type:complete